MEFRANRAEFYRDLAEMFRRGESMLSFLEGELANSIKTRQRSRAAALRLVLSRFVAGHDGGRLEQLLRGVVPASDSTMLLGVERSAIKADALESLAQAVDQQAQMKRMVLLYSVTPAVILPICIALISIMSGVIGEIDQSTPDYVRDQVWSGFNGVAKMIADIASSYGPLVLAVIGMLMALIFWSLPRWTGRLRLRADTLPVYSLYRDFQAGILFTSMAMLLKTGGSLRGTIEDLAQRSSTVMRWQLVRVLRAFDDAPNLGLEAFGRGVLSPHLFARAMTLQRTSTSFSEVLIELGTTEGGRVLARVKRAAIVANVTVVGFLATIAAVLGMASITVPGTFAAVMEPTNLMVSKRAFEAEHPLGSPQTVPTPRSATDR